MAESEDCSKLITKAIDCIMKKVIDNLHIALIIFIVFFLVIGLYQSDMKTYFGEKIGITSGSGMRNQIEMFKNPKKRGRKLKKI